MHGLMDIEELHLQCRSELAREHAREAIVSYKAGAYRSCIISTWNAVVYDYIDKLHELDLFGDSNAKVMLSKLERIRSLGASGISESLKFEKNILDDAKNIFELLSDLEYIDLQRLLEDRHRCAHPTFHEFGVKYEPCAEISRSHLRHAIEILLAKDPVQGKAALGSIWEAVGSKYFPRDRKSAKTVLEAGPLARPKRSLIRGVLIGLSKAVLLEEMSVAQRMRIYAALGAVSEMHPVVFGELIESELPSLLSRVGDDKYVQVLSYFARVPNSWESGSVAEKNKSKEFLLNATGEELVLGISSAFEFGLGDQALVQVERLSADDLEKLILLGPRAEYIDASIALCADAGSFRRAEALCERLVLPVAHLMNSGNIVRVLDIFLENMQVQYAAGVLHEFLPLFLAANEDCAREVRAKWKKVYEVLRESHSRTEELPVMASLREKFPGIENDV